MQKILQFEEFYTRLYFFSFRYKLIAFINTDTHQIQRVANLTDNAWLYGASLADIEYSIRNGRQGMMPAQKDFLSEEKIHVLAAYVISLSRRGAE